jgi:hypothetical protein
MLRLSIFVSATLAAVKKLGIDINTVVNEQFDKS